MPDRHQQVPPAGLNVLALRGSISEYFPFGFLPAVSITFYVELFVNGSVEIE